jgi:hypothetical protein
MQLLPRTHTDNQAHTRYRSVGACRSHVSRHPTRPTVVPQIPNDVTSPVKPFSAINLQVSLLRNALLRVIGNE